MNNILSYISSHWTQWLFAAVSAVLALGYRNVSKRLQEEKSRNEAIANGVQCLLRLSIIGNYNKYRDREYCPIYAKESVKQAYQAYHNLGGNDVATNLYQKILEMPEEPKDEVQKLGE